MLGARCLENSNSTSICDLGPLVLKPLGSKFLLNLRLKSQIPVLFSFFCYLPGVIVSCCALDASKTQTGLVSAIFRLFVGASWQQFYSKLAPEITDTNAVSLFLPSRWCCCDLLRVRCFEHSNSTSICDVPLLCWSLLATLLFKTGA